VETSETIERRLAGLPVDRQVAYLAICVEHVKYPLDQTGDLPVVVRDAVIQAALAQAWAFVEDGTVPTNLDVDTVLDAHWEELGDDGRTEVQHLASAATMLVCGLPSPRREAHRILNHLDACAQIMDPKQAGHAEESEWRAALLEALESLQAGATLSALRTSSSEVLRWQHRYLEDWWR
jgi:hypothetical protein